MYARTKLCPWLCQVYVSHFQAHVAQGLVSSDYLGLSGNYPNASPNKPERKKAKKVGISYRQARGEDSITYVGTGIPLNLSAQLSARVSRSRAYNASSEFVPFNALICICQLIETEKPQYKPKQPVNRCFLKQLTTT
eukprot:scaffold98932_cov18-Prasinocladus_malaysianus.AAC.1